MAYLDQSGFEGDSTDRIVESGACGYERPDRVFDFGSKVVLVECDENQHSGNPCVCEQTRMINLSQSFGGLPVYFIRWNPDEYDTGDEPVVERQQKLVDVLTDIRDGKGRGVPEALCSVFYMYYDGWESVATEEWKVLQGFSG
jgi:hypothetical protein